jgi:hypothetical protein
LYFHKVDNNIHNTKKGIGGERDEEENSMANPSPGNSITLRVEAPSSFTATSELAAAVAVAGAAMTALDVTESLDPHVAADVAAAVASAQPAVTAAAPAHA